MSQRGDGAKGEKVALYLPDAVVAEMRYEASRLGRSMSWLVRAAWMLARERLRNTRCDTEFLASGVEREKFLTRRSGGS